MNTAMDSRGSQRRSRSQSQVIGVVLLFGMVLAGALIVVGVGATALDGTESELSDDRAEKTLTQLDSRAGLVALGEANSQKMSLPTDADEQYSVEEDAGTMQVMVTNLSDKSNSFELVNTTLGAVVYEADGATVGYQGGGVWRRSDDGQGSMVSPPEFHYRDGTLTLPVISVVGDSTIGGATRIEKQSESRAFPLPNTPDRLNPLDNHRVDVTVQSTYYEGWGEYFAERTDGSVEYDHANESVTVTLVTPVDVNEIKAASASLSAGGEFVVSGSSALDCSAKDADDVFTSSYNSSTGKSYCDQFEDNSDPLHERLPGTDGDVIYGKDVDISSGVGGSNFYGDLTSGQTVTIDDSSGSGQVDVFGNISYVDACLSSGSVTDCDKRIITASGGQERKISRIQLTDSIDWFINTSLDAIEDETPATSPALTDGTTLDDGQYHYDSIDLASGAEVELNTTDGPVIIAVDEDVILRQDATFNVTGDEHVELYVGGEGTSTDMKMADDAEILAPNDNGTQFRTYGGADFSARLGGGGSGNLATYTGVIYAPPGSAGTGTVVLDGAQVFGGILTGETTLLGGSMHYDEALEGKRVVPEDARIIRVTYLHVSESTIELGD